MERLYLKAHIQPSECKLLHVVTRELQNRTHLLVVSTQEAKPLLTDSYEKQHEKNINY